MAASTTSKGTNSTTSYKTFDVKKLTVLPLEDNKLNNAQKLAMVRYANGMCQLQTHKITLNTKSPGGVPQAGPYYATDKARGFIKVSEDVTDPNSVLFFKQMETIDVEFQTQEFKNKLFGSAKAASAYTYQPIVRTPEQPDDEDDTSDKKKKGPYPRYVKFKIDLHWETGKVQTKCFQKDGEGKRIPVPDVNAVDDFAKVVRWNSSFVTVIVMNKLYASKNKVGDSKKYGVTFKMSNVCAEQSLYTPKSEYDGDAFLEDDDNLSNPLSNVKISTIEDDVVTVKVDSKPTNQFSKALDQDDDEDEDEEDDEGDEEDEVVEVKQTPVQPVQPVKVTAKPSTTRRSATKQ